MALYTTSDILTPILVPIGTFTTFAIHSLGYLANMNIREYYIQLVLCFSGILGGCLVRNLGLTRRIDVVYKGIFGLSTV